MTEPKDLDEVVDMIIKEIEEQKATKFIKEEGISHHGTGTSIRNRLNLWWSPDWKNSVIDSEGEMIEVFTPKPALVAFFNEKNIYHADDISGTINEAVKAKLNNKPFAIDEHIKVYFKHWEEQGFENGIFKLNN